jgi:hypothetical protein
MSEPDYPSGAWTGFYNYGRDAQRNPMDLFLNFSAGRITGDGVDDIGSFVIAGTFSGSECQWTKTYPGSHEVTYRGFREGKGIWGLWDIPNAERGGFHIWPLSADGGVEAEETAEEKTPEAFAPVEHRPLPAHAGDSSFPG